MSAAVVVVGAINVDLVVATDRLPGPGETVVGRRVERHGGGKGANAAVAAARAGGSVRLVGAVGDDEHGESALAELRAEGVDATGVAVLAGEPTGVALIVVDAAGENQIAVAAGANAALTAEHVRAALGSAGDAGCVLVSTEVSGEAVCAAVELAAEAGVRCVLNPAPVVPAVLDVLPRGPLVTPNATEVADLARALGEDAADVREAAGAVVARTGAPVVVTLGAEGALVLSPGAGAERVAPHPAAARDTTGAGDTFNGVLAVMLAEGAGVEEAARAATVAAALSVAEVGARAGMPDRAAIDAAAGG